MTLPKTFNTERLILRAVDETDVVSYEQHFVDYEVIRHLSSAIPWPFPKSGVSDYIKNVIIPNQGNDKWVWGIYLKSNPDEVIGVVDLWREGKPEHRGFWLGRKFWNKGIMTEAVAPINTFAFSELGFDKLIFSNAVGNTRSRRIKEKTGATLVGVESASFVDPAYSEHEIWQLTKTQWFSLQEHKI